MDERGDGTTGGGDTPSAPGTPGPDGTPPGAPATPGYGTPPAYGTPPVHGTPGYGSEPPGPPYPQAPAGQPGAYPAYGAPYDPYTPHPPYGPYAPYGPYGGAYGAPFRSPEAGSLRTQAIVALVVSLLSVVMCCFPLGIAATITSAIALSNVDSDLVRARTLVRWSWGLLVASLVLAVLALVGLVAIGAFSEPSGV